MSSDSSTIDAEEESSTPKVKTRLNPSKKKQRYGVESDTAFRKPSVYDAVEGRITRSQGFAPEFRARKTESSKTHGSLIGGSEQARVVGSDEYWSELKRRRSRIQNDQTSRRSEGIHRLANAGTFPTIVDENMSMIESAMQIGLPDSDLLKQLHVFASEYYASQPAAEHMYRLFDGSALMALGLIIQEHIRMLIEPIAMSYALQPDDEKLIYVQSSGSEHDDTDFSGFDRITTDTDTDTGTGTSTPTDSSSD